MKFYDDLTFSNLPGELRTVFSGARNVDFLSRPEWYDIVSRHGLEQGWRARVYASDGAAVVASVRETSARQEIRACCTPYTTEHAILLGDNVADPEHAVRQLASDMARDNPYTDAIHLNGFDPHDASFSAALLGLKDAGFTARLYFCWGSWYETVAEASFEEYLSKRPPALQNTWRRKSAALMRSGESEFHSFEDGDVDRFIADYAQVYRRSWKTSEPFPHVVPALIRMAHRAGALRMGVLSAAGTPIAAQFWIVWRGIATLHKLAHDDTHKEVSPGTLLTMHMIRRILADDKPQELNFGRGDDDYKKLWVSSRRERWGIEAANPRTLAGLGRSLRIRASALRDHFARNGVESPDRVAGQSL